MSENQPSIEIIAASIEEAIEKGLAELGVEEEQVEIDILDSGSKGLFGLGTRQARVRLTVMTDAPPAPSEASGEEEEEFATLLEESEAQPKKRSGSSAAGTKLDLDLEEQDALRIASEVVEDLLDKMGIQATVTSKMIPPEDDRSRATVWVDVRGNDLSVLIGPHAETLNALQYIASLIAAKELDRPVPLVVDVEGFRARRLNQLRTLARRMADQAVKTGRKQVLEPMPASERRVIHMELKNHPMVKTESTGEEPRRKVTIIPK